MIDYITKPRTNALGRTYQLYVQNAFSQQLVGGELVYQVDSLIRMRDLVPQAHTIVDIGMNVGHHTIEYATWAECVHGFEPIPQTHQMAQHNIQHARDNPVAQGWYPGHTADITATIHTHCVGMGTHHHHTHHTVPHCAMAGRPFDPPTHWQGNIYMDRDAGENIIGSQLIPVEIRTLDSYGFDSVDVIKVNASEREMSVLLGSEDTISRCRPVVQVSRWWSHPDEFYQGAQLVPTHTPEDMVTFFQSHGYCIPDDATDHTVHRFFVPR
jgi:FkbM family methyltransferase